MTIEWKERRTGVTPANAWTFRDDLGNGFEIMGNIELFYVSGLFGWVVIWRPDEFQQTDEHAACAEVRIEGYADSPNTAKAEATQAIQRLQAMAAADSQMLIRLQTITGGS